MPQLTQKEVQKIQRLRNMFPRQIGVRVSRSADGGFMAEVTTFPGCFTEADTFSELIEMVNDAVRTMLEIPPKYVSFMPEYLASLYYNYALHTKRGQRRHKPFWEREAVAENRRAH